MGNNMIFVCFVHNNFGLLQGEEEISCLMVTREQKKIDDWLEKQIADEDINTYKGRFDYIIPVSKGNEKEGYDHYYIFCKPAAIE